jgi:hypothetical protein
VESTNSLLAEYIEQELQKLVKQRVEQLVQSIDLEYAVQSAVDLYFAKHGVDTTIVENSFERKIKQSVAEKLIASNIQWGNYKLNGNQIHGGTIEAFSSTGIVDRANDIELVVKDGQVVCEGTATVRTLEVVENAVVEGDLTVKGSINGDTNFVNSIRTSVEQNIVGYVDNFLNNFSLKDNGTIKIGQNTVLTINSLGPSVTSSNLRNLGILQQLEVSGETSLSDTLTTTTTGRVGINTTEPDSALTVWDNEVKINVKKLSKRTAYIGVPTGQELVLGIDDSIICKISPDQLKINGHLQIKDRTIGFESSMPGYSEVKGSIRYNSNPSKGVPAGWICLGNTKWAEIGTIQ